MLGISKAVTNELIGVNTHKQQAMVLDIIVALVVAFGFYTGYSRGLIKTVFDTLSLAIGIIASLKLSPIVIGVLEGIVKTSPAITFLIGIVITFLAVMALVRFVGRKLESILEAANINFVNKLAGGALQGLFFAFLLSLGLWLMNNLNILNPDTKERSMTYSLLEPLPEAGKGVFMAVKPVFSSFWNKTIETMDKIKDKAEGTESTPEVIQ